MSSHNMIVKAPKHGAIDLDVPAHRGIPSYYTRPDLDAPEGIQWRQVLRILRRHWKASLAFVIAIEAALGLLVFSLPNSYQARAILEIDPPGVATAGLGGDNSNATPNSQDYVDTQSEILQSDGVALAIIETMHLDQNPVFLSQSWVQKLVAYATAWIPGRKAAGNQQDDTARLLKIFRNGLSVSQVRDSRLLQVQYESHDPKLSAGIVSTLVQQYLDEIHRSKFEATERAAQSVAPELKQLQQSMQQSNQALLKFQNSHVGAELGSSASVGEDGTTGADTAPVSNPVAARVSQLNQQLTQAIADRLQQQSYMKLIAEGQTDALPQMKDDALIQQITESLVASRAQLAQALTIYGGNNPQVRKLQEQTLALSQQLDDARNAIANQIKSAYTSAMNREELIRTTLQQLRGPLHQSNADVLQYNALKRQAEAEANLYTTLSTQIKQMAISGSLDSNNIRIMDPARVPQRPSGPHRIRILGVGMLFGFLGGIGLAFVAEGMNDTISSADDIRRWSSLPALALVPQVSRFKKNGLALSASAKDAKHLRHKSMLGIQARGLKFLADAPHSAEAEAIRNLETSIRLAGAPGEPPVQTVLITSAFPGEGKTTVAVNLAIALARHGKTCLVDADFRHPVITSSFGLTLRAGLKDLLSRPLSIKEICLPHPDISNLTVLGTGTRNPDTPESLTSKPMRELANELRKNFDYVVLDSPPIIPFSEARWLSTLSDRSVLVARCSATTRRALMWSLEILEELDAPVLGIVLNGVDLDSEYYAYGINGYSSYMKG